MRSSVQTSDCVLSCFSTNIILQKMNELFLKCDFKLMKDSICWFVCLSLPPLSYRLGCSSSPGINERVHITCGGAASMLVALLTP